MTTTPSIHVRDEGTGTPIVFLHAFPLDSTMWDEQVATLRGHHRCLRPDFWGCGESAAPGDDHSIDTFADQVLRELARLGVQRFHLVGSSFGGYIALSMLALAPQRITKLVLAGSRATADGDEARAERRAMASAVLSEGVSVIADSMVSRLISPRTQRDGEVTSRLRQLILAQSPGGVAASQDAMAGRPDRTDIVTATTVPVRIICGSDDVMIDPLVQKQLAEQIPGARCHAVEGAGHLVNIDAPGVFTELVDDFFDAA